MDLLKPGDLAGFASGDRALMLASWANAKVRRVAVCFRGDPLQDVIDEATPIAIQALEQFVLYTGIRPTDEQFQKAVDFARQ